MCTLTKLFRVFVVAALTAGTFMGGVQWEKKILAPQRRKATMAKFKAINAARMKQLGSQPANRNSGRRVVGLWQQRPWLHAYRRVVGWRNRRRA